MKENRGITLATLVITVVVLAIIAGITIYSGIDVIKRSDLESMRTNMLLIQAKAKEYVEEINFRIGQNTDTTKRAEIKNNFLNEKGYTTAGSNGLFYLDNGKDVRSFTYVTSEVLNSMGLSKIAEELKEGEVYLIDFDVDNMKAEIYNTLGYEGKYSLTELEELQ